MGDHIQMYCTVESTEPVLFSLPIQHRLSYRNYKIQNTLKYTWLLKTISLFTWCFYCFPYIVICNLACSTKSWEGCSLCTVVMQHHTVCQCSSWLLLVDQPFFSPSKSCTPDLLECLKVIGWGMETDLTSEHQFEHLTCDMWKSQVCKYKDRRGED